MHFFRLQPQALPPQALVKHHAHTDLKFTLDGRLVGDLGEAVALEFFDLVPCEQRTSGVDALVRGSRETVQVKATGSPRSGPAFSPGKNVADLLLFIRLDFEAGTAAVVYNGPEAPVRASLRKPPKEHTVVAKLADVRRLAAQWGRSQGAPLRPNNLRLKASGKR